MLRGKDRLLEGVELLLLLLFTTFIDKLCNDSFVYHARRIHNVVLRMNLVPHKNIHEKICVVLKKKNRYLCNLLVSGHFEVCSAASNLAHIYYRLQCILIQMF